MTEKTQNLLEEIKTLTILEMADLVAGLESTFGVTATAVAASGAAGAAAEATPAEVEKTEFDVILADFGTNKINVIKVIREITGLGLKEAKELVDSCPKTVKEGASKEDAEAIAKKLEEAGAKAEIK